MQQPVTSTSLVTAPSRSRRLTIVALSVCLAALIAALTVVLIHTTFAAAAPFTPTVDDGLVAENAPAALSDADVPAIHRLDPALRDAMLLAEADAAVDGITFQVTSGWRSTRYQQWLLDDAIDLYASEEIARQYVATPERSSHVKGRAVDIGPVEAQFWLIEHGARHGICQTYANERWHFELATEPGGTCPTMKADAAG